MDGERYTMLKLVKDRDRLKVMQRRKIHQKKAGIGIIIWDKADFTTRKIIRDKECS